MAENEQQSVTSDAVPEIKIRITAASFDPPTMSMSNPCGDSPTGTISVKLTLLMTGSACPITIYKPGSFLDDLPNVWGGPLSMFQTWALIHSATNKDVEPEIVNFFWGDRQGPIRVGNPEVQLLTLHPDVTLQTRVDVLNLIRNQTYKLCAASVGRLEPGQYYKLSLCAGHIKYCAEGTVEEWCRDKKIKRLNLNRKLRLTAEEEPEILIKP